MWQRLFKPSKLSITAITVVLVIILYFVKSGGLISKATDISNWKIYQNNTYGFESKYPENYSESHSSGDSYVDLETIKECESLSNTATTIFPNDCESYTVYVHSVKDSTPSAGGQGYIHSQIAVDGIQAEKVISPTSLGNWENIDQEVVWFQKGDNWYILTFTFNHAKSQEAESVMNQIISSFKFVN